MLLLLALHREQELAEKCLSKLEIALFKDFSNSPVISISSWFGWSTSSLALMGKFARKVRLKERFS